MDSKYEKLMCSFISHGIQSFGFALILIGVNYLIFRERELAYHASDIEYYVNQAVSHSIAYLINSMYYKMISIYVVNMTVILY